MGYRWRTPIHGLMARVYAARTDLNVWQFAEKHLVLTSLEAPGNPGPYRIAAAPHTKFFQECCTNPLVKEIVVKKTSQGAFTESALNFVRWTLANRPRNILYALDSQAEMRRVFRVRLIPSLQRMAVTACNLSEDPDDTSSLTILTPEMWIMGCGGHAAGALANKAASIGILDEADKHSELVGDEGNAATLLRERFKTVADSKLIILSKPVHEHGLVTTEFLTGTQHKFFIPCPHCGTFQEWIQERLVYRHCRDAHGEYDETKILKDAFYECGSCNKPINEDDRRSVIPSAEWRQTNFRNLTPQKISMEQTDFASLFPQATLGHLALDLLHAQRTPAKMRQVQANRFAKAWSRTTSEVKPDQVLSLCGDYDYGTLPWVPQLTVMAVDVQEGILKWVIAGFRWPGEMAVVSYGVAMRFADLHEIAKEKILVKGLDQQIEIMVGIIDEGHRYKEVRSFVIESWKEQVQFVPSKGRGGIQTRSMKSIVGESTAEHEGYDVTVYHFDDDAFKYELYLQQICKADKIRAGVLAVPALHLPHKVDPEFVAELTAEKLMPEKTPSGYEKLVWKKVGEANDWGDCVKIAKVSWTHLAPDFAPAAQTAAV